MSALLIIGCIFLIVGLTGTIYYGLALYQSRKLCALSKNARQNFQTQVPGQDFDNLIGQATDDILCNHTMTGVLLGISLLLCLGGASMLGYSGFKKYKKPKANLTSTAELSTF
jgi:hypothetical protein